MLNAGAGAPAVTVAADTSDPRARSGRSSANGQNTTPMAQRLDLSPWDPDGDGTAYGAITDTLGRSGQQGGRGAGGFGGARGGAARDTSKLAFDAPNARTRVVMQFPLAAKDMLLSGTLENGELLAKRAQLVDQRIGNGHVVLFAIRPFWRWQTQGTYMLGFNAIMNWNDLDAGQGAVTGTVGGG